MAAAHNHSACGQYHGAIDSAVSLCLNALRSTYVTPTLGARLEQYSDKPRCAN
jgi:hypothetical protein